MFVLKVKYDILVRKYWELDKAFNKAAKKWNELVEQINKKGGEEFLQDAILFSDEELNVLIRLCHPDKHNSSPMSTSITGKLITIKQGRK